MNVYDNFRVSVSENGEIINLNELLAALDSTNITDELEIFLTNLENRINNSDFTNKVVLVNAIQGHLLNYEANKNQMNQNNSEALKLMQEFNDDLKKLGIISTKKENNDSRKNIDYITYTNDSGVVEVLVCLGENTLNEYIRKNSAKIATSKAKDIFHHFKEYIHGSLSFDEISMNNPEKSEEKVREESIKQAEYEEVKKYANTYSISAKIEVSIDPNGERIYRVKDGLFKFKTENGIRVMEVLQIPSITQENTDDLISELEKDAYDINMVPTNKIIDINTHNAYQSYETLPSGDLSEERINEVMELLQKKDIYGVELSSDDLRKIDITIKALIESMPLRAVKPNIKEDSLLDDFMAPLLDKYNKIQNGIIDRNALSDLENRMCEEYIHNREYIAENHLNKDNNKKLELSNSNTNYQQSGMATIVMLLEIMLLALFIVMFYNLDI